MCKCNPPPRLIASQDFSYQAIDAARHAAQAGAAAETVAAFNSAGSGAAAESDRVQLVLLDLQDQPCRNRRYKMELKDKVIEGTTDRNGVTQPLTAAEHAGIVRWHVEDETAPG
jgi:hypothetical protein